MNISENNLKDPLREIMKEEINKKLQNTKFTFEILEEKYSKDEHLHILYDIKGQSIWFDEKYMKTFKWSESEYFSINCFKILGNETNQGHPLIEIFLQNFEEKPKEFVCKNFQKKTFDFLLIVETSPVTSGKGVTMGFKARFERVDDLDDKPIGCLLHLIPNKEFNEL